MGLVKSYVKLGASEKALSRPVSDFLTVINNLSVLECVLVSPKLAYSPVSSTSG